jgi:hypothetical protein
MHALRIAPLLLIIAGCCLAPAGAQTADSSAAAPAPAAASGMTPEQEQAAAAAVIKASENPVGNIAVIPFQNNWNPGVGPYARTQYNLNIQPVVPIELTPTLTLIARSIIPLINQPSPLPPTTCATTGCPWSFGLGDVQEQFYIAPKVAPGKLIWGAGPVIYLPTATPAGLGAGKTSIGPTVVALIMPGTWVIGILANQAWSVIGPSSAPSVSVFYTQPFVNYNFGKGWSLTSAPGITANWNAPGNNKWTVPLGMGIVKTFKLGDQPQQLQLAYYGNIVRPIGVAYSTWRLQWSLLYPVKR